MEKINLVSLSDCLNDEEIKSAKTLANARKVQELEEWLMEQDAEFQPKSKYHYHIFLHGKLILQIWPTTGKFFIQSTKESLVGFNKFKNTYKKLTEVIV